MSASELEEMVITHCTFNDGFRKKVGMPVSFEGYLLENARLFDKIVQKPDNVKWGKPKECFYNSAYYIFDELVRREEGEWAYCEGLAVSTTLPIPIHHGWLVNAQGEVLDLTWQHAATEKTLYYGVVFSPAYVSDTVAETRIWGMFCPGDMFNRSLLSGEDDEHVFHRYHASGRKPQMQVVDDSKVMV